MFSRFDTIPACDGQPASQPRRRSKYALCISASRSKQETQLSLTNLCDAFVGQSRSPNIVPFHMLDIVSYCAIVTLSIVFKTRRFYDIRLQKCSDLENRVRGPSRSLEMSPCDRAHMTSY